MLDFLWDQAGLMFPELLKPDKTLNADRYQLQMISLSHTTFFLYFLYILERSFYLIK